MNAQLLTGVHLTSLPTYALTADGEIEAETGLKLGR